VPFQQITLAHFSSWHDSDTWPMAKIHYAAYYYNS